MNIGRTHPLAELVGDDLLLRQQLPLERVLNALQRGLSSPGGENHRQRSAPDTIPLDTAHMVRVEHHRRIAFKVEVLARSRHCRLPRTYVLFCVRSFFK